MSKHLCAARAAILALTAAAPAYAQSYSDPAGSGVLVSAVAWLQGTLLGTFATVVAVVAVAAIGFMMLAGRTDVRRAVRVIFGCFVIFGASTIARGIMGASSAGETDPILATAPPPPSPQAHPNSNANATPFDPYAGAALPSR